MHGLESEMYNLLFVVTKLYLKRCLKHRFFIYYHIILSVIFDSIWVRFKFGILQFMMNIYVYLIILIKQDLICDNWVF